MKNYFKKFSIMFVMALSLGILWSEKSYAYDISNKYINAVPKMTSNNSPSGVASADGEYSGLEAYKAFDGISDYYSDSFHAWGTRNATGKLCYEFPEKKVISAYSISYTNYRYIEATAGSWKFEGWDGEKWITLDSRSADMYADTYKQVYEINNNTAYKKYQLDITSNSGAYYYSVNLSIGELELLEKIQSSAISLNKSTDNLQVGQTDNLTATTTPAGAEIVWSSSDSSIATVDSTGKVTGIKEGQAIITSQIKGLETKATCTVNVTKATDPIQPTNPTDNTGGTDETSKIVNIAHAKGENTNNAGGDVSIIFKGVAEAQLSVVKTADVDSVYVGDTFTYTIVVTNTSSKTAKTVVVNDSAPNHIDFSVNGVTTTQGKIDPSSTSKNIVVNVGDIPPLGTVTIKIPATVIL